MNVRLAFNPGPVNTYKAFDVSDVRLADHPEGNRTLSERGPTVRLAYGDSPPERNGTSGLESPGQAYADRPALLVSYVYLGPFLKNRHRYHYRDWVMDSGAFSAHNSGTEIRLQDYIDTCKRLMAEDPTLTEVFALDVIGDWRASLRNAEEMWRQGVPAIPCYHINEPESVLKGLAKDYPKLALGGVAKANPSVKLAFAKQCFARVWPCRIHGFGYSTEATVLAVPWHSVDATNWEIGPCAFGRWQSFGKMSVRGSKQNLRAEVEWYLKLERRARQRWRREMEQLASAGKAPAVRRAAQQHCDAQIARSGLTSEREREPDTLPEPRREPDGPTVRLAYAETGQDGSVKIDKAIGKGRA